MADECRGMFVGFRAGMPEEALYRHCACREEVARLRRQLDETEERCCQALCRHCRGECEATERVDPATRKAGGWYHTIHDAQDPTAVAESVPCAAWALRSALARQR